MKHYYKNPRKISITQLDNLRAWLEELGDLSGIVHDLNSDQIIGGNQRAEAMGLLSGNGEIVVVEQFDQPTKQGTVMLGYFLWNGERYNYRQVRWTEKQCEKANIIANRAGGEWDKDLLAQHFEVDDLLQWGFELEDLSGLAEDLEVAEPEAPDEFPSYDEDIETEYECPKCGYRWSGKPNAEG